jgi:hypothetical protein
VNGAHPECPKCACIFVGWANDLVVLFEVGDLGVVGRPGRDRCDGHVLTADRVEARQRRLGLVNDLFGVLQAKQFARSAAGADGIAQLVGQIGGQIPWAAEIPTANPRPHDETGRHADHVHIGLVQRRGEEP